MKRVVLFVLILFALQSEATNYRASMFGIKSDGIVLNTRSIQKAIDFISQNGGGELQFSVGRYLTGSIHLKSNVTIRLNEGAILVGSINPYDYDNIDSWQGLLLARGAENIAIVGSGVIEGRGREMAINLKTQIHHGFVRDDLKYDRAAVRPKLIYFRECKNVTIDGIQLKNAAFWTQTYDQCVNLTINNILVDSKNYWNNDGLDIVDCRKVVVSNSYIDASDDAICLKSHDPDALCEDILIYNCVARSSASGIKFGTATRGGFKNIRIINNRVFDTYRSAITIASVDGAEIENILVDSLYVRNTGNIIFLRTGKRWGREDRGYLRDVTISNVVAEVPLAKADAGYPYEGPVEDMPRNISPSSIMGTPAMPIENVTLRNIEIIYPGGGNKAYAYRGTSAAELAKIPEMIDAYPEFSQFKELPAWAFFIRHAKNITFDNVVVTAKERDYRPAIVLDDVKGASFSRMKYNEPGRAKRQFYSNNSTDIKK